MAKKRLCVGCNVCSLSSYVVVSRGTGRAASKIKPVMFGDKNVSSDSIS